MTPKRIVVLGGVGFIGSHLCHRLLTEGHEVFCIDLRDITHAPQLRTLQRNAAFHYIHHNIIHPFGIRCDELYNLAAPTFVHYSKLLPVEALKVNMVGSIHALDTARTEHARVVLGSTGSITNMTTKQMWSDQPHTTRHSHIEGRMAAESLHRAYRQEFGVDTRIARIYNTYGTGGNLMDQRVVSKMLLAALQNRDIRIEGSGEQVRTFCYVDDIVEGLMALMGALPTDHTRIVNLGSDEQITILALAQRIIELTGSRSKIIHVEPRAEEIRCRTPDLEATRRELGWSPSTRLDEGLKRTIEYTERELSERAGAFYSWIEVNN
ncbi:MAG: NAD-dependent epimerase/dehydratase family protein [Rikenellaceae bacterium]|nr:NAD-dependent epimerase/dehydratase family protein [Rikenellaceae bacterium]